MRLAIPDFGQEDQIHQAGIGLLNLFGQDFFSFLDGELCKTEDPNWLTKYKKTSLVYHQYSFSDPANLLKELLRVSNSPLRKPLRKLVSSQDSVLFYKRLQEILDDRNDWIHHNSIFSNSSLKSLILNMYPIASMMSLPTIIELDFLLSKLEEVMPEFPRQDNEAQFKELNNQKANHKSEINEETQSSELEIGHEIIDKFLQYSYVLHTSGEIRDRKTNQLLNEINPEGSKGIGEMLIKRKQNGGRLRITENGIIAAYFGNHWGFLARVNPEQWFPNHIHHQV
jgi:hypothetical protein